LAITKYSGVQSANIIGRRNGKTTLQIESTNLPITNPNDMSEQHKPNCSINTVCAVYHANGICNHPKYGKCDCGLEGVPRSTAKKCRCGLPYNHDGDHEDIGNTSPKAMNVEDIVREFEKDVMAIIRAADKGNDTLYGHLGAELVIKFPKQITALLKSISEEIVDEKRELDPRIEGKVVGGVTLKDYLTKGHTVALERAIQIITNRM